MKLKMASILLGSALSITAADDLAKLVRGQDPITILSRQDVAQLPFFARDQLLLAVSPEYRSLSPADAFGLLREQERVNSVAAGLKPLKDLIWYRNCTGTARNVETSSAKEDSISLSLTVP